MSDEQTTTPPKQRNPFDVTHYRLAMIEETLAAIKDNLQRLGTLEERHLHTREALERAFAAIETTEKRVRHIEQEMPTLRLVRGWVIGGVIGTLAMLGAMVAKLFTLTVG